MARPHRLVGPHEWLPSSSCSKNWSAGFVIDFFEAKKRLQAKPLRPPRIIRLLTLAEEMRGLLERKSVNHYGLGRLYGMSTPRVTQILNLLKLHPAILEFVRTLSLATPARAVTERKLRALVPLLPEEQLEVASRLFPGFAIGRRGRAARAG